MPGDWMSVSTTPTRWPSAASRVATLAAAFDLPVPPRNEWTEMTLDIAPLLCASGYVLFLGVRAEAKLGDLRLQVPEIVGLGDLGHLPGGACLVNLDAQLPHLLLQQPLTRQDFDRHPLEDAGQLPEGVVAAGHAVQFPAFEPARLDIRRGRDDTADLLEILLLEIVKALPRQPGVDPGPQQHRIERLRQVVFRAHLDAPDDALDVLKCGDHDDRRVPELRLTPDALQHLIAVHAGHQHIQQHAVEQPIPQRFERFQPVRYRPYGMAVPLEAAGQEQAVHHVVVGDENAAWTLSHRLPLSRTVS